MIEASCCEGFNLKAYPVRRYFCVSLKASSLIIGLSEQNPVLLVELIKPVIVKSIVADLY